VTADVPVIVGRVNGLLCPQLWLVNGLERAVVHLAVIVAHVRMLVAVVGDID
jgi:hypothetical protein